MKILLLFLLFSMSNNCLLCEDAFISRGKISKNRQYIENASKLFHISSNILSAIIFTERVLNYDISDEAFDLILAKSGFNSSIGFCQIKIKTAYFIEIQINHTDYEYSPGAKYAGLISVSKSPDELINKLSNDSINVMYAAAYLRIIQSRWVNKGYSIDDKPDIIGSIYSMGMFDADGKERIPHWNPTPTEFGKFVLSSIYYF